MDMASFSPMPSMCIMIVTRTTNKKHTIVPSVGYHTEEWKGISLLCFKDTGYILYPP